jgi:spore germination protein PB
MFRVLKGTYDVNLFVHQNIVIHSIKIEGISNSSILQIGSAGVIKSLSQLYNTGGFTAPVPQAGILPMEEFSPYLLPLVDPDI